MAEKINYPAPFLSTGPGVMRGGFSVILMLLPLVVFYSFNFDPHFMLRFFVFVGLGAMLELLYVVLETGKFRLRSGGSMVTAALLVMSIPVRITPAALVSALVISIFIVRMPVKKPGIVLNPVLIGRLFLMVCFSKEIVEWSLPGIDTVASATPLELFKEEGEAFSFFKMLLSKFRVNWHGLYEIIPGAPGDLLPFYSIIAGIFLFHRGVLEWRVPVFFLLSFFITTSIISSNPLFQLLSGSVIFSAVFIAGDPKSTPASKGGRIAAGIITGVINGCIRRYTYYSEGIVFSFLSINILAPLFDRISFQLRSTVIKRKHQKLRS